jgi:hypothetical protein
LEKECSSTYAWWRNGGSEAALSRGRRDAGNAGLLRRAAGEQQARVNVWEMQSRR